MRHFRRSVRWRQALVAACLPYLLLSVVVDFVHVHGQVSTSVYAPGEAALTARGDPAHQPDRPCTVCLWLRSGLQLTSNTPTALTAETATSDLVLPADAVWPDSPTPRPAPLRGPPSSLLG